jgi:dUTPase
MQTLDFFTKATAKLPDRSSNSVSIELYANIVKHGESSVELIMPGASLSIDTGVSPRIASAFIGLVFNTRTQRQVGVNFSENFNVITAEDREFLVIKVTNNGSGPYTIFHNQHIANLVIIPSFIPTIQRTNI